MTTLLKNAKVLMSGLDISGQSNALALKYGAAALEETVFADDQDGGGTHIFTGGLKSITADYRGFLKPEGETYSFARVGGKDLPVTIAPRGHVGDPTYFFKALKAQLDRSGQVGQLFALAGAFQGRGTPLLRGTCGLGGYYRAGTDNRFLASHVMQSTNYTLAQTTLPASVGNYAAARRVSITHTTDTTTDTLGNMAITGTDEEGAVQTENVAVVADGVATSLKAFKTVTALRTATWVQAGGVSDLIKAGFVDTGVAFNLGAVADEVAALYAILHVYGDPEGTLPTLDVTVESDASQAFPSPATAYTFAQQTARGGLYAVPVEGPLTDTWWRIKAVIGGTSSPAFKVHASLAVAAFKEPAE